MLEHSKTALRIILQESIKRREHLKDMAEQYTLRAKTILEQEVVELDEQIRDLQTDLEY